MILLAPYRTDAPIYHFPVATIGLIAVNVLAFFATIGDPEGMQEYILQYGHGLKPIQWITSNFLHAGFFHLLGNMLMLWTFGLLVEGKVGPLIFLPVYLGIGFVQCGLEQLVMSGSREGGSLGASAILFGLMAIAMVWSPRNDVSVGGVILIRPVQFDAPILLFALLLFGWELVMIAIVGTTMSTAVLHMSGAIIGLVVGIAFVKFNWVDCEGWDLFAVMSGEVGEPRKRKKKRKKKRQEAG